MDNCKMDHGMMKTLEAELGHRQQQAAASAARDLAHGLQSYHQ